MTDHTFSEPLATAFERLVVALDNKANNPLVSDEVVQLHGQVSSLETENAALKATLAEMKTREAEIQKRLDAAITQVDAALAEE